MSIKNNRILTKIIKYIWSDVKCSGKWRFKIQHIFPELFLFVYLKKLQRRRIRETSSISWFIPQTHAKARAVPGWSQYSGIPPRPPTWWTRPKHLDHVLLHLTGHQWRADWNRSIQHSSQCPHGMSAPQAPSATFYKYQRLPCTYICINISNFDVILLGISCFIWMKKQIVTL